MMSEDSARQITTDTAPHSAQPQKEMTYWLTRERDADGKLNPWIDVWLSQPKLEDHGTRWACSVHTVQTGSGEQAAHYTRWTVDQCLKTCRVYPETERECIRVGD